MQQKFCNSPLSLCTLVAPAKTANKNFLFTFLYRDVSAKALCATWEMISISKIFLAWTETSASRRVSLTRKEFLSLSWRIVKWSEALLTRLNFYSLRKFFFSENISMSQSMELKLLGDKPEDEKWWLTWSSWSLRMKKYSISKEASPKRETRCRWLNIDNQMNRVDRSTCCGIERSEFDWFEVLLFKCDGCPLVCLMKL